MFKNHMNLKIIKFILAISFNLNENDTNDTNDTKDNNYNLNNIKLTTEGKRC